MVIQTKKGEFTGWDGTPLVRAQSAKSKARTAERTAKKQADDRRAEATEKKGALRLARALFDDKTGKVCLREDQLEPFNDFRNKDLDLIVQTIIAGRRWGKTTYCAAVGISQAIDVPESLIWWVTPSYSQGIRPKIVMEYILDHLGLLEKYETSGRAKTHKYMIPLKNGSEIHFRSWYEAENLLGAGVDVIIIDEARLMKKDEFQIVFWPMILDTEGRIVLASSAGDPRGFLYDCYLSGLSGKEHEEGFKSYLRLTSQNPTVKKKRLDIMRKKFGRAFPRECEGIFMDLGDKDYIFSRETIQIATVQDLAEDYRNEPVLLAIDGAGKVGYTGWCAEQGGVIIETGLEQLHGAEGLIKTSVELVKSLKPILVGVDGTGMGQGFEYYLRDTLERENIGCEVKAFNFSYNPDDPEMYADWRTEKMFHLRDRFDSGELIMLDDEHREFVVQLEGITAKENNRKRLACTQKRSRREHHSEDTVDACIMVMELKDMLNRSSSRKDRLTKEQKFQEACRKRWRRQRSGTGAGIIF